MNLKVIWLTGLPCSGKTTLAHQIQLKLGVLQYGSETIISTVFYALVLYFMFISYAMVPKYDIKKIFQKTFDVGTKKFFPLISMFLIFGFGFFIIDLILKLLLFKCVFYEFLVYPHSSFFLFECFELVPALNSNILPSSS